MTTVQDKTRNTRENSLGWMIQRLAGALNRDMTTRLAAHDLSLPQFAVMMTVLERGHLPQTEIGTLLHSPPYAISRAVDRLEEQGRIVRRPLDGSRRAVGVHVTPKGQALAEHLHRIVEDVNAELVAPLPTDKDRDTLKRLLQQILPVHDAPA